MDEAIFVLSPMDAPMISGRDADGLSVVSTAPVDEISFSWMTEQILTPRSALQGAVTTGDAFITVTANDRLKFSTGDLLVVVKAGATEYLRVTGYGTTADTLLVTRGYDGTTATNYADLAEVVGLGTALAEGSDPEAARSKDRDTASNFTQIFGPTAVHMSATEQIVNKYGVANEFSRQLYNRQVENTIAREQAFLYGRKTNSTATKIRTTGGLVYFITTKVEATSTQLNIANITALNQVSYNNGGIPDRIMANPASLADLNAIEDTTRVRQTYDDDRRGRQPVMTLWTEFGPQTVVRNRWLNKKDAIAFNRDGVVRRVMRPLVFERLAKTGDSDKGQIVCEEGLECKGESHMWRASALAY